MLHQATLISALLLSATCSIIHQAYLPTILFRIPQENVNYNFAYEVNDRTTGDIKSQSEARRGDTVLGQYSLLQPDGVTRTVEYKADDREGFKATVSNDGTPVCSECQNDRRQENMSNDAAKPNVDERMNEQVQNERPRGSSTQSIEADQSDRRNPVQEPMSTMPQTILPPSRSVVIQSVPNLQEPRVLSVLHN
ncbi:uncharacterized protein LOC105389376 [Plutella xylostella]|uniref:uncharacterized protein LOC105389376 n=1 Tax=Plutella xylostella TaxID=51655 RepID=UPI00203286F3|nr:uncharacterized protein LOC105389376 [Plutella xylostella]